jgi:hypothetical protein
MSEKYPGGIIRSTPVTPAGPYQDSAASGIWTLDQATNFIKQGNWPTAGNVNPNAFIENLFSTYLYTGNGSTQTITNGIDLAGQGGLVWSKARSNAFSNYLCDTVRGRAYYLYSDATVAQQGPSASNRDITTFNANGYSLGPDANAEINTNSVTFVSWTFRKQAKFFDVVTYTGSNSDQTISHNLGSTPGCIMIKKLDSNTFNAGWAVYHRSLTNPSNYYLVLNTTAAETNYGGAYISSVNSSTFTVAGGAGSISIAGSTYVAYLFAHNAGGFGLTGTDNVISCGSYTGNGSATGPTVTLGYEPQWLLVKRASNVAQWYLIDNMRGMALTGNGNSLYPNTSQYENQYWAANFININSTGFQVVNSDTEINASGDTYIYIAIRRGPMRTPTSGTSVFSPNYASSTTGQQITTNFPVDSQILRYLPSGIGGYWFDRLRGVSSTTTESGQALYPNNTNAETAESYTRYFNNTGYQQNSGFAVGTQMIGYSFARAPGFFDVVCGTGPVATAYHNLGVIPEMIIMKRRNGTDPWWVVSSGLGSINADYILLNTNAAKVTESNNLVNATSTTFSPQYFFGGGNTWVAYLFATLAGVSKVGSYTGTGTTLQVNCGFTGGARFVMIKRTDSTGDWYVWDSARGIVAGNDPYLLLNSTAAEVTNTDYVDTYSAGFEISSTAPAGLNANGGTYIFLAIA